MTKSQWIDAINERQDFYVSRLSALLLEKNVLKKEINFNSPTGTGKTVMMAKLISSQSESDFFFLVTTLSRGGLSKQVKNSLASRIPNGHYAVFGTNSFTASTKLQASDILFSIPKDRRLVWIRDEGHIKSNNWMRLLEEKAYRIINISATNAQIDIQCNFTDTPLLRTPYQMYGTPKDAVLKLLEIKKIHESVPNYNPCMIVRDVNGTVTQEFESLCADFNLKSINITDNDADIQSLCRNEDSHDVIINKMKITEGIDIPRANVIYIGNRPNNEATVIQLIGRVRRNALLWHEEVDIFRPENQELLVETTKTYIFYGKNNSAVHSENNELCMELSDTISLEHLLPDEVTVVQNRLQNGYKISELDLLNEPYSGVLKLSHNADFVTIANLPELYSKKSEYITEFSTRFKAITKDAEMVEVAFDKCKFYRTGETGIWRVTTTVTDNIQYGKLHSFITKKYADEISSVVYPETETFRANWTCPETRLVSSQVRQLRKTQLRFAKVRVRKTEVSEHVYSFGNFQKRFALCESYLTEYYFKYLLYGTKYLEPFYSIAKHRMSSVNQMQGELDVLLYASVLCHKKHAALFYGNLIERLIPTLSAEEIAGLAQETRQRVADMARRAYEMLFPVLFPGGYADGIIPSPHLGNRKILHGVANVLTEKKIVQFSCSGKIAKEQVLKVLAYHFLSTKRSDLRIDEVIVYDFKAGALVKIPILPKNLTHIQFCKVTAQNTQEFFGEIAQKFDFRHIKSFFHSYGEELTMFCVEKSKDALAKNKVSVRENGKTVRICQKEILSQAHSVGNAAILQKLLEIMKPSKYVLLYAVKSKNLAMTDGLLLSVRPNEKILDEAIDTGNIELVEKIVPKIHVGAEHLQRAVDGGNAEIAELVAENLNVTKYNANAVIRTKNKTAVEKLVKKVKLQPHNIECAMKTADEAIIRIVSRKI